MAIDSILALIDAEIASLTQVRSLLASTGKVAVTGTLLKTKKAAKAPKKGKKRRKLSAEARKRIADAQRKRWAAQKAKAK
jgi:GTP cyclohydrolase FolE2